jgi:hypothetical protein
MSLGKSVASLVTPHQRSSLRIAQHLAGSRWSFTRTRFRSSSTESAVGAAQLQVQWQCPIKAMLRCPPPAWPNPSLKGSANGRPPGPGWWYAVHFHQPGPGALPLSPP